MNPTDKLRNETISIISKAAKLTKEEAGNLLEKPPEGIDADIAFPCFVLARKLKADPKEIAETIGKKLKPKGLIGGIEIAGSYVNFYADWDKVGDLVLKSILREKNRYGSGKPEKERIMIEFAHPNTHKAFHIGHVRNISLGESLSRILEFHGNRVVRTNYQGDIGPHVAKCLWGFINIYKRKAPAKNRGKWLGDVYRKASREFLENERVQEEVAEINRMLYANDKKIIPVWKKTRQWSLDYFDEIYKDFGVKFNRLYFETEVEKPGKKISEALLKKGIAKESEGAIIMDMEKHNLGTWVLLTKDGISLYSAKDLALAEKQVKEYKPDKIIHVVGSEQTFYFKQLFKAFELTDPGIFKKEYHLRYELVNLPSGKMKSREGKVILYEELKSKVYELALKVTKEKNPKFSKKEKEKIAMSVALGALKYSMLMQSPEKVIIFDWDRALDFQGNSAPYLQYTHARMCSILKKAKTKPKKYNTVILSNIAEKAIIKKLSQFPETVSEAASDMRPHYIANYAYTLCDLFNNFYQNIRVLKAEPKVRDARLALTLATKHVLENTLKLLGIDAPEVM